MDEWRSTVENMVNSQLCDSFAGKKVLVTGHTGFKGVWLCHLLQFYGANVLGFSDQSADLSLFESSGLKESVDSTFGDIRNFEKIFKTIESCCPDYIFHLAARAIVSEGYLSPLDTFEVNVMGTAHILETVRLLGRKVIVVCIASDKCYENFEWDFGYREIDSLGGSDPYSASKGASEVVVASYIRSFFRQGVVGVASARSGNVIGPFDFAANRIVPDCIRAISENFALDVRNAGATRPWQHVLEPLFGYLTLASRLNSNPSNTLRAPFNFGPDVRSNRTVNELLAEISLHTKLLWNCQEQRDRHPEAGRLHLNSDKAFHLLGWTPTWNFEKCVENTVCGYLAGLDRSREVISNSIESFANDFRLFER